jgi:hypothetical protein
MALEGAISANTRTAIPDRLGFRPVMGGKRISGAWSALNKSPSCWAERKKLCGGCGKRGDQHAWDRAIEENQASVVERDFGIGQRAGADPKGEVLLTDGWSKGIGVTV